MSNRVKEFKYKSEVGSNGRPRYALVGVPQRDLSEADIARLSPEQYDEVKSATSPDGKLLYHAVASSSDKAAKDEKPKDQDEDDGGAVEAKRNLK